MSLTDDQARTLAKMAATVDSGCSHCVAHCTLTLMRVFPDQDWRELIADENPAMSRGALSAAMVDHLEHESAVAQVAR